MNRWLLAATLSTSLCSLGTVAHADDASAAFNDPTCPQANDAGRKLNALNAAGNVSGDDLMAASQGLVDAYRDCVKTSDHDQYSKNSDHQSDYIGVSRIYSRLQLSRSYQRIGSFYEQLHQPDKAKDAYTSALAPLSEIDGITSGANLGLQDRSSPEFRMETESKMLHDQLESSIAKLPAAASPAPVQQKP